MDQMRRMMCSTLFRSLLRQPILIRKSLILLSTIEKGPDMGSFIDVSYWHR